MPQAVPRSDRAQASPRSLRIPAHARYSEIVWPQAVTPGRETFTHDVYVSSACVGTAGAGVRACTGRPGARKILNLLLEAYSGKEIELGVTCCDR